MQIHSARVRALTTPGLPALQAADRIRRTGAGTSENGLSQEQALGITPENLASPAAAAAGLTPENKELLASYPDQHPCRLAAAERWAQYSALIVPNQVRLGRNLWQTCPVTCGAGRLDRQQEMRHAGHQPSSLPHRAASGQAQSCIAGR